jgi:hypothetical protein
VVVHDLDGFGAGGSPAKANAKLIVDPNAVLAGTVALERFQAVAWRNPKIIEPTGDLELSELPPSDRLDSGKPRHPKPTGESLSVGAAKRGDHGAIVTSRMHNGKHA